MKSHRRVPSSDRIGSFVVLVLAAKGIRRGRRPEEERSAMKLLQQSSLKGMRPLKNGWQAWELKPGETRLSKKYSLAFRSSNSLDVN